MVILTTHSSHHPCGALRALRGHDTNWALRGHDTNCINRASRHCDSSLPQSEDSYRFHPLRFAVLLKTEAVPGLLSPGLFSPGLLAPSTLRHPMLYSCLIQGESYNDNTRSYGDRELRGQDTNCINYSARPFRHFLPAKRGQLPVSSAALCSRFRKRKRSPVCCRHQYEGW
jgi:hypothetical protein